MIKYTKKKNFNINNFHLLDQPTYERLTAGAFA